LLLFFLTNDENQHEVIKKTTRSFSFNRANKLNLEKFSVMLCDSVKLLISTIKHMKDINQLLLIPLTIWSGLEQSFLGAQFTKVNQFRLI